MDATAEAVGSPTIHFVSCRGKAPKREERSSDHHGSTESTAGSACRRVGHVGELGRVAKKLADRAGAPENHDQLTRLLDLQYRGRCCTETKIPN